MEDWKRSRRGPHGRRQKGPLYWTELVMTRRKVLSLPGLLAPSCWAQSGAASEVIEIRDVTIIDPLRGSLPRRTVVIQDDRITQIVESPTSGLATTSRTIDGTDRFLIPGLWDMHVHLSNTQASALPMLLAYGVTNVRDIGGRLSEIDVWRGEIQAGKIQGPRIFRSGPMLNGRFSDYQLLVTNASEARGAVRALERAGVDFIKLHRMTPREAYFGIADEAKKLEIPFAGHIPRTVSPEEASDAGQWTIEHVETLFEGTFSNARDDVPLAGPIARFKADGAAELFDRFARNRNWWTPTLAAFEAADLRFWDKTPDSTDIYVSRSSWDMIEGIRKNPPPAEWLADREVQFPHHQDLVGMAQRSGVGLLAGTDMAARIVPGVSLHRELELLVDSGLSPIEALRAATANPAQAFQRGDLGRIEVGRTADMVLLSANPLEDISNLRAIEVVVAQGRLYDRQSLDGLLAAAVEAAKVR